MDHGPWISEAHCKVAGQSQVSVSDGGASVLTWMFRTQSGTNGVTVTRKAQVFVLWHRSLTVQVTVVLPTGKMLTLAGTQIGPLSGSERSSVAVTVNSTATPAPSGEVTVTSPGQFSVGGMKS